MSTTLRRIQIIRDQPGWLDIAVPPAMVEEFKEMVKRGTYFGTQTSPDMKEFVDNILDRPWCERSYMKEGAQSQLEYVTTLAPPSTKQIPVIGDSITTLVYEQSTEQLLAD